MNPHPTDTFGKAQKPVVESAIQARQGRPGRPMLIVLLVSGVLAILVWFVIEYSVTTPDQNVPQTQQGETAPTPQQPSGEGSFNNNPANGNAPPATGTDRNPAPQSSTGAP
jgi:cytoskeletal protein RodZ